MAFDGLRTVVKYPYVMALAGISCLYEMVLTILDYEMKVRWWGGALLWCGGWVTTRGLTSVYLYNTHTFPARQVIGMQKLARHPHASEHFAELMGHFGQATNALSFLFSLLGTR